MAEFPVVRGKRLRATKISSCGLPIAGVANRVVTKGFVTLSLGKVNRDAQDLEQTNADGEVCVADRTAPERKWYTPALELCNVNTELITLFNGWEQYLDYDDSPIGFRDNPEVEDEYGVALELWTGGRSDDDCPTPTTDSIFSSASSGVKYGYWLLGGTEWELGDVTIGASVSTFTLTGKTIAMPHWGRGPYNVSAIDSSGTAGRLLVPVGQKEHLTVFRTPIAPPPVTNGGVPLEISSKFVDPDFYFGGPGNAPAADVAPAQIDAQESLELTITGTPAGGTFTLKVNGVATGTIVYNASAANVKTALAAVDDGYDAGAWTTSGGSNLPGGTITIVPPLGVVVEIGTNSLTGGTSPTLHLDAA